MQKPSAFSLQPQHLLLGILVLTTWAYLPSLGEIARGDQWGYLADTAHLHDWTSLTIKSYAYNRDRQFIPGDEILFRPIFYFMLGMEKWLFGYHFAGWQAVGLSLHLIVIWQLYKLLSLFDLGSWGALLAGLMGTFFATLEMVTWHNIHAYLLFTICILAAIRNAYSHVAEGQKSGRRLVAITALIFCATLCYETALPFAVLFSIYLWTTFPGGKSSPSRYSTLLPVVPIIIYATASIADFHFFHRHFPEGGQMAQGFRPWVAFKQTLDAVAFWIFSGLFSTRDMYFYSPVGKMAVYSLPVPNPFFPDGPEWVDDAARALGLFTLLLLPLCFYVVKRKLSLRPIRPNYKYFCLLFSMITAYVLVIVLGRFNSRGAKETLFTNLYDGYIFWVLAIVLGGCLIRLLLGGLGLPSSLKKLVGTLLLGLIACNALRVHRACAIVADSSREIRELVIESENFARSHSAEPDFSFSVDPGLRGNRVIRGLRRKDDPPDKNYTVLEILFPDSFRQKDGKYFFDGKSWKLSQPF